MKNLDLINQAIDYIEHNLTHPLTVEVVAAAIGYSRFHFTRLFQATTGMAVVTYLRRRRLHEAACQLVVTKKPILDIALDYQFDSQEAFTRAFKRMFSVAPGRYRRRGRLTRCFSRLTLRPVPLFRPGYAGHGARGLLLPRSRLAQIYPVHLHAVFLQYTFASTIARRFDGITLSLKE